MFRLQCESLVYVPTPMWFTSTCSDSNVMSYITLHTMLYTRLYIRFYIMLYTMLYIMLYTMPYTRLYTGLYTRLYIMLYIMLYTRLYIGHEKGGWFKIMPYSLPGSWVPQVWYTMVQNPMKAYGFWRFYNFPYEKIRLLLMSGSYIKVLALTK